MKDGGAAMRSLWLIPMALLCALLFGLVLYLRLDDGDLALRLALLAATGLMAVAMVRYVGSRGGQRR